MLYRDQLHFSLLFREKKESYVITHVSPLGSMDLLSQLEVDMLKRTASSDLYQLFRNCSLAVLNSGSLTDSSKELLSKYQDFDINVLRRERGVKLELVNPQKMPLLMEKLFALYKQTYLLYCAIFCLCMGK